MDMRRIAQLIREQRNHKKWSQQVLAEKAGVALQTVHRIEAFKSVPPADILFAILEALGIRITIEADASRQPSLSSRSSTTIKSANLPDRVDGLEERILAKVEQMIEARVRGLRRPEE